MWIPDFSNGFSSRDQCFYSVSDGTFYSLHNQPCVLLTRVSLHHYFTCLLKNIALTLSNANLFLFYKAVWFISAIFKAFHEDLTSSFCQKRATNLCFKLHLIKSWSDHWADSLMHCSGESHESFQEHFATQIFLW